VTRASVAAVASVPFVVGPVALGITVTVADVALVARESHEITVAAILASSLVRALGVAASIANLMNV